VAKPAGDRDLGPVHQGCYQDRSPGSAIDRVSNTAPDILSTTNGGEPFPAHLDLRLAREHDIERLKMNN
jgi:hypothetical protein